MKSILKALTLFVLATTPLAQANEPISAQDCTVYVRSFDDIALVANRNELHLTQCKRNYAGMGTETANEILSLLTDRGYRIVGFGVVDAMGAVERPIPAEFRFTFSARSQCSFFDAYSNVLENTGRTAVVGFGLFENSSNALITTYMQYVRQRRAANTLLEAAAEKIPQCIRTGQ